MIVLLKGARVPFVMRRREGEEFLWEIIGDGYLHGIMSGEAWEMENSNSLLLLEIISHIYLYLLEYLLAMFIC